MVRHLPFFFPRATGAGKRVMSFLESERLILRPPRPSDIQAMTVWLGDFDVSRNDWRACLILIARRDAEDFVARRGRHGDGHYNFADRSARQRRCLPGRHRAASARCGLRIRLLAGQALLGPGLCHARRRAAWSQFAFEKLDARLCLGRLVSRQSGLRPCAGEAGRAPQWQPDARLPGPRRQGVVP